MALSVLASSGLALGAGLDWRTREEGRDEGRDATGDVRDGAESVEALDVDVVGLAFDWERG